MPRQLGAVAVGGDREPLTVLDILRRSTTWLGERGSDSPRLDAELLVAHGLGLTRLDLYLQFDRPVEGAERDAIRALIRERGRLVPVAYLTGTREFWSLPFHVEPGVLVPRPETEHLVEVALPMLQGADAPVFADVGTGSGCVAIALLHEVEAARAHATELHAKPLEVARRNAERHGVADRLTLYAGDLLEPLRPTVDFGRLDAIVSNPPYVRRDDASVERGVRDHEPPEALFVSGEDALEVVRRLATRALDALRPGGLLAVEIGHDSADDARALFEGTGYVEVRSTPDLAGVDRIISGRRAG
jgi:release factor glutamine methyltransferase